MKAYTINDKLLGVGCPSDEYGQLVPEGITAFMITAIPETAAPNGVYDLTDYRYYAITTDINWHYSANYQDLVDKPYDFEAMAAIYQFNSNDSTVSNYREMNFTVSNNLFNDSGCRDIATIEWDSTGGSASTNIQFYPGVYLNSMKSTANDEFPPEGVNGPLSGVSDETIMLYHSQDLAGAEIYLNTAHGQTVPKYTWWDGAWHKYKVIGDCTNGNISAFYTVGGYDYHYMGYTNLHTTVTSLNGLYCYDYYSPNRGTCSAKNFGISGFNDINDAIRYSGPYRKILAY